MTRRILAFGLALGLLTMSTVGHADSNGANNDLNHDGFVDTLHQKSDHTPQYNEQTSYGYRTVGLTVASIDPHWNNQNNGLDTIRILPYSKGAEYAITANGLTPSPGRVWPFKIFSAFTIVSPGGHVTNVAPTTSGSTGWIPWAKAAITIAAMPSAGAAWYAIASDFLFSFVNTSGSSAIQDLNGTQNYAYNNSYFNDYPDWANSGNTDMPYTVAASQGHLDAYKSVGIYHQYYYIDDTWATGSKQSVQAAAQIQYWYYDQTGYTYSWTSPTVYQGYYAYGH